MARAAIRDELFAAHAALTADVLACGTPGDGPRERFDTWGSRNASPSAEPAARWPTSRRQALTT